MSALFPSRLLRALAFLLLFLALQTLYRVAPGRWIEVLLIEGLTVPLAAGLLQLLAPSLGVVASGAELIAAGGGLRVYRGCEGSELLLLWTAAMAVAPLRPLWRMPLLVGGLLLMVALNQLRVLLLFFAHREWPASFEALHDLLLPLLLVAAVGALFMAACRVFAPAPAGSRSP
jgi:exosortase/archaeosortase family protein